MKTFQIPFFRISRIDLQSFLGLLAAALLFVGFSISLRLVDPTAAPIDAGIFSIVMLPVVAVLIFQIVTKWLITNVWPVFATYAVHHFENNFKLLEPWQKVIIYLCFYLGLLFSFVACLAALL